MLALLAERSAGDASATAAGLLLGAEPSGSGQHTSDSAAALGRVGPQACTHRPRPTGRKGLLTTLRFSIQALQRSSR